MKWYAMSAAAAAVVMMAAPAKAETFQFFAAMNAANEPVPVSGIPISSPATGTAFVTFDDIAKTVTVVQEWFNLTSAITVNHIHCCTVTPLTGTSGTIINFTPGTATSGGYSDTFVAGATANFTVAEFQPLLDGVKAGTAYVNLHTANNPGGEIRGFLTPVPEPETYALMLAGLAAMGAAMRRRKVG